MCGRAWTLLWLVSMAAPARASGPADTAARVPVKINAVTFITRTRWVGTYHRPRHGPHNAKLAAGSLQIEHSLPYSFRFHPGAGASGSCELVGRAETFRAIYRLEGDRLLICVSLDSIDPRPSTLAVTAQSDLFILKPSSGK